MFPETRHFSAGVVHEKVGYQTCGEPFEEAGVEHIMMKKDLN
ncbi:GNAT family N-acetyltransferase [Lactobacillus helveticus]|nr:GNAT family N-acetyltransferase [Lactobacillus helveticus]